MEQGDNRLIRLAFNGAAYHGFQVQANARTICAQLQDAMQRVFGSRPDIKGCSRTDAGVHARDFAVSFRIESDIPDEKLPLALNQNLPGDIRVFCARRVPPAFHARYSAAGKEYRYVILNSAVDDVFTTGQYHRVVGDVDAAAMHTAGQQLVGRHNFAAFMSSGSEVEDTVRTVQYLRVERQGRWVAVTVAADGFLYNMVRIIAGTLLRVGQGRMAGAQVGQVLAGRDRGAAGETLPAQGLFLNRVFYPEDVLKI